MPALREDRSIGELFGQLSQDMTLLVRQELQLARPGQVQRGVHRGQAVWRPGTTSSGISTRAQVPWPGTLMLVRRPSESYV